MRRSAVATSDTAVAPSRAALVDGVGVEAVVHHEAGAGEDRPGDDRQPADVRERQAGEPGVGRGGCRGAPTWPVPTPRPQRG